MNPQIRGPFYPVPDIDIEAYLCGDLDGAARRALEAELEQNPKLQAYLTDRRRERAKFLESNPFSLQLPAESRRRDGSVVWGGLLAAVALLAVFIPGRTQLPPTSWPDAARDTVRVKGSALSVDLFVKRGEQVFRHRPGASAIIAAILIAEPRVALTTLVRALAVALLCRAGYSCIAAALGTLAGRSHCPVQLVLSSGL